MIAINGLEFFWHLILVVAVIVLLLYIILTKGNFFQINKIVKNYVELFDGKRQKRFILITYILITVISVSISCIKVIDNNLIDGITIILSILTAAFLGFIPVVIGIDAESQQIKITKLEVNNLLIFEILMSTINLMFCFVYMFIIPDELNTISSLNQLLLNILSFIIYDLSFILLINVLILLKRIGLLITASKD